MRPPLYDSMIRYRIQKLSELHQVAIGSFSFFFASSITASFFLDPVKNYLFGNPKLATWSTPYDLFDALLLAIMASAVYFSPLFSNVRPTTTQYLRSVSSSHAWLMIAIIVWLISFYVFLTNGVQEIAPDIEQEFLGRKTKIDLTVFWAVKATNASIETIMHLMPGVLIYHLAKKQYGKTKASLLALLLCWVAFVIGHLDLTKWDFYWPFTLANLLFSSFLFIALYQRSIWTPIIFHIFWNFTIFITLYCRLDLLSDDELSALFGFV